MESFNYFFWLIIADFEISLSFFTSPKLLLKVSPDYSAPKS